MAQDKISLASATQRIMASLVPDEILIQLCRETRALAKAESVFGSYVAPQQPWGNGIHVRVVDDAAMPLLPEVRSAAHAIYRRLALHRRIVSLQYTQETEEIFRGLHVESKSDTACCVPIFGRMGSLHGALILIGVGQLEEDVLPSLQVLCNCAPTALENAFKFVAAREHQDRLLVYSEATQEALWDWRIDSNHVWWGGGIWALLATSQGDIARTIAWKMQRIHADDRERVQASLTHAMQTAAAIWQEVYRFQRADGSFALVEDRAYLLRDVNGQPCRIIGRLRDITEIEEARRREKEAIREREKSEDRTRLAIEATRLGTWDINPTSGAAIWNDVCYELFGIPADRSLTCDEWLGLINPDDRDRVRVLLERALDPTYGGIFDAEYRIVRVRDRLERWLKTRGRVHFDPMRKPVRFVGTVLDISERKFAEDRLQLLANAGERLVRTLEPKTMISEIAQLGIHMPSDWCFVEMVDDDGGASRVAVAHTDSENLVLGKSFETTYVQDPNGISVSARVMRTGRPEFIRELTQGILPLVGNERDQCAARVLSLRSALVVPMRGRDRILGTITLAMAESGRCYSEVDVPFAEELARRAALALDNARLFRQAQEAIRLRDEFLSIASHELKTPITPLQLQLDLLERTLVSSGVVDDRITTRLNQAKRQTQRLTNLVDHLLDVSRIRAGRLSLEREHFDLVDLVIEVAQRFTEQARENHSSIQVTIKDHPWGRWDRLRIDQVLANLLSNAIKYGSKKPIEIVVAIVANRARVDVRDQGIGIASEDAMRIFGQYERAVSMRNFSGLGLGLYIARQLVEAHGGTISVRSILGEGSTFTVELPLTDERTYCATAEP